MVAWLLEGGAYFLNECVAAPQLKSLVGKAHQEAATHSAGGGGSSALSLLLARAAL